MEVNFIVGDACSFRGHGQDLARGQIGLLVEDEEVFGLVWAVKSVDATFIIGVPSALAPRQNVLGDKRHD